MKKNNNDTTATTTTTPDRQHQGQHLMRKEQNQRRSLFNTYTILLTKVHTHESVWFDMI